MSVHSLIGRPCRGCSHPTICRTHGCAAKEGKRNLERPKVRGVGRVLGDSPYDDLAYTVHFDKRLSDDQLRALHEYLREFKP